MDGADSLEGGGFESPFEIGLAFEGAKAGARGVDDEGVGDVFEIGGSGFRDGFRGNGGGTGAFSAGLEGGEFFFVHVHGENAGFVSREGGKVEGFSPGTGAGVNDAFAGLGIEQGCYGLGGWVLDLDATVEAERFWEDFSWRKGEGVGMVWEGSGLDIVLGKPGLRFFDGGEEGVYAEEDGRFFVECGELGFPEIAEFRVAELIEPIGDGLTDCAGLIGDEGLAGEDFICREAVVLVPLWEFVAHEKPLGGNE